MQLRVMPDLIQCECPMLAAWSTTTQTRNKQHGEAGAMQSTATKTAYNKKKKNNMKMLGQRRPPPCFKSTGSFIIVYIMSAAHWRGRGVCGPALRVLHTGNRSHWRGFWCWIPRTFLWLNSYVFWIRRWQNEQRTLDLLEIRLSHQIPCKHHSHSVLVSYKYLKCRHRENFGTFTGPEDRKPHGKSKFHWSSKTFTGPNIIF